MKDVRMRCRHQVNTTANIILEIYGKGIEPSLITEALEVFPTRTEDTKESEKKTKTNHDSSKESLWQVETGYYSDIDIVDLVKSFLSRFSHYKRVMKTHFDNDSIRTKLLIVMYIDKGENVGVVLDRELASAIADMGWALEYKLHPLPFPGSPTFLSRHVSEQAILALEHDSKEDLLRLFTTYAIEECNDLEEGWSYLREVYKGTFLSLRDICSIEQASRGNCIDNKWFYLSVKEIATTEGIYYIASRYCLLNSTDGESTGLHSLKFVNAYGVVNTSSNPPTVPNFFLHFLQSSDQLGIWYPNRHKKV